MLLSGTNVKHIFKYFIVYIILIYIDGINAACSNKEFECDNGNCINQWDQCDGIKNCPDGSDETAANCIHLRGECYPPFFLCPYGACVLGNSACNGVANCLDKSDETLLRCGDEDARINFSKSLQANCKANEIKCGSGNCIENHRTCDGVADCEDAADETVEICGHIRCDDYLFTCGYGACIAKKLECDGKNDCFDGSDETPLLCNKTRIIKSNLDIRILSST